MNNDNTLLENNLEQDEFTATEAVAQDSSPDEMPEENVAETEDSEEETPEGDSTEEGTPEEDFPEEEATEEDIPEEDTPIELPEPLPTAEEIIAKSEASAEDNSSSSPLTPKAPYHERYYLKYGEGKRTTALDLSGTKAFLQDLGFDGGELRQARIGKDDAEKYRGADGDKNSMRCSYCGAQISGVDFYRLPDGRLRCTSCSNSVVNTKAEVEEICERILTNMENFFGATIDVPVAIEVVDERKLKKKIGASLGTKDDRSVLILGVAIEKKKKYSMILENGAPRISLIATFAHELTHIWQYTHWDNQKHFKKCPKKKRLLIYEGMAKWAEIQYLYLIGETAVAKREEAITRGRNDEYGIGFCLYEDKYPLSRDTMTCNDTPFITTGYPID